MKTVTQTQHWTLGIDRCRPNIDVLDELTQHGAVYKSLQERTQLRRPAQNDGLVEPLNTQGVMGTTQLHNTQ